MNEIGASWDDLRIFLAVAREGGLSPAAQLTGRSPATLSRRMLALERSRAQTLFVRHDRGYTLTAEGKTLLAALAPLAAQMDVLAQAQGQKAEPVVKVSAGSWTTLHLVGHIQALSGTPSDVVLRFVASEAVLDMPHREVAVGIRNQRPTEPNLAGRRAGRASFAPYATRGAPNRWIKVVADTPSARWVTDHAARNVACEVTSPRNSLDLALAGYGIALLPTFIGSAHAQLVQQGDTIAELSHDRWVVSHQDDRHLPEVRRVVDRLYDLLTE
ncbi:MAG: LysR family transcriptional regulator [Pseudomonadota bacterium]